MSSRVKDQTTHPAFAVGAHTYAALFDMKSDSALRDVMTFEEGVERYSMYYLQPRSQEELRCRNRAHRKIANFCFGLMGRTPNAFAGNLTGLSLKPEGFDSEPGGSRNNLLTIYQHVRRNDLFANLRHRPSAGCARNKDYYLSKGLPQPALAHEIWDQGSRRRRCRRSASRDRFGGQRCATAPQHREL